MLRLPKAVYVWDVQYSGLDESWFTLPRDMATRPEFDQSVAMFLSCDSVQFSGQIDAVTHQPVLQDFARLPHSARRHTFCQTEFRNRFCFTFALQAVQHEGKAVFLRQAVDFRI